ncbi:TonB-dependent receptor [Sphingomonas ginkgonis]|uniref:TonB-dependent receptor n=1 Tax=Sphingomonas ginkgonis TaxID=2315330 RepID=A0A429V7E6_9SPHN|nr:TonB-dependent receptor [Sphingomonas ginkgonis]RST29901.1 TonB-dependent receptor [Sphingomonas ginkgonis]
MKPSFRQWLLSTTLVVGTSLTASAAYAQTAPTTPTQNPPDSAGVPTAPETTAPQEGQTTVPSTNAQGRPVAENQDIVVTGSRIPQPNLTSASPVTVVTAQEVKLQGTTRVEDLVNSLPQSFAAQGSNVSNGSTGTATVNLRGLGSSRTLVLVNGRRLMPGDPRSPVADINFIPSALIKRVDVLTGGASSVYGADAVAGVVNFIMDTTFTGIRVEGQVSTFNHDNRAGNNIIGALTARNFAYPKGMTTDGLAQDISVAMGASFDDNRGHVTGYFTYRKQDAILQADRDYSACGLSANTDAQVTSLGRLYSCGGSGTSANGTFQLFSPTFASRGVFQVGPNRTFIAGSTPFNFAPYNYYQRPDERYTAGVFADYEISPAFKPYMEAMFMDDQSIAQIAPSGDFGNTSFLNCDNPLLSAQQRSVVCAPGLTYTNANGVVGSNVVILRRNVEGGGRQDDLEHTDYRIVGGMRGDITRGLSYDASYQFGKTILAETYLNDFSITRLGRALDVVANPAGGAPVCRSVLNGLDPNCVPYDIFGTGSVTPAALNYLQTPGFQRGNTQEQVANINFTGELGEYGIKSPWSERGLGLNVGAEYRKEKLVLNTDQAFTTGDLAGQGGATIGVSGQFHVRDLFAEVQVPIVSNSFFYDLNVSGGYRNSKYYVAGNSFSTDTYKLAAEFAPVRDVRFRGSYNRAVRAPNIVELFSAQSVGLAGVTDPCAGAAVGGLVNGFTAAQCALTGVTAAQFGNVPENPASQYNGFTGGNPNVSPEKADSYTLGVILQPRFIPGLAVTVDGFDIRVKNLIGTIGVDTILSQCLTTADPFFCSRIHRDQFGSLYLTPNGYTVDTNTNVGGLKTRGIDVNGSYARRIGGLGNLNLSFVGTYLDKLEVNPLADIRYDCAGFFGVQCGTPNPKWRHKFRVGFTLPSGIGLSGQWRYFSRVRNDALSSDTDLAGSSRQGNNKLKAQSYFDLALQAKIQDHFNFRIGANNILDKAPPVAGSQIVGAPFGNGNTYPQVYDSLGRYLFAGVTVEF